MLQYNLKHAATKEVSREMMNPPAPADLPSPAIKKFTVDSDTQNKESTTPIINLHQPAINKTSTDLDFKEFPIDTLVEYIENMEVDHRNTSLHSPKISMTAIQEEQRKSKGKIITPAQFYRLQE